MKKVLFIDRDGTLILEPPVTFQIDSLEKLTFYPFVFKYLGKIAEELDYELVIVSNQDGLGTPANAAFDHFRAIVLKARKRDLETDAVEMARPQVATARHARPGAAALGQRVVGIDAGQRHRAQDERIDRAGEALP